MAEPRERPPGADLLLVNALVVPCDGRTPFAGAVAVRGGGILALGAGLARDPAVAGRARVVDCAGGALLPGFVDAHLHFLAWVDALLSVDLRPGAGVRSIEDLVARMRRAAGAATPGAWLKGKGYDDFYLAEGRHPNRWDLDRAGSDHPIKLTHRTHHAHVLNSRALRAVGIDRYTPDPPEGLIDRDLETGEPTGVLFELGELLSRRIPAAEGRGLDAAAQRASTELLAAGVTTFQDATHVNDAGRWAQFGRWRREGVLRQRVSLLLGRRGFEDRVTRGEAAFPPVAGLELGGLKIILDRTTGDLHPAPADLLAGIRAAHGAGWPVAIHAVEAETLEAALAALEHARSGPEGRKLRDRVEHGSLCPPRLVGRLASAGVTVVTQPSFLFHHGERYLETVPPERIAELYPLGSLLRAGVRVAASSDCPVVPARPLLGVAAAVTRTAENGAVLCPEERIPLDRALALHTREAAWAVGLDASLGTLAPGKRADLVVLERSPFSTSPEELRELRPVLTVADGEVVWEG